ncbi:hypothetical protein [Actinoplanes sp. NPDC026623]|uniref:hypothetical protein n=1 Tax=Actinoplanes sp. NPDC026623 TaxID=3155610 RepID=UPI0033E759B0
MEYDFTGSVWWATSRKLTSATVEKLRADTAPSAVLAGYEPVASEFQAGTLLKLVLTGCGPATVVVKDIHASILKKADPLSGSVVWQPPQGDLDVTSMAFDLDSSARPAAFEYDVMLNKRRGDYFLRHATQVSAGETVPFAVMGLSARSYVEWSIVISTLVSGHPWEFAVLLPGGRPIRTTAVAATYQSAYLLDNVGVRYEPVDPTQLVAELHGSR